MFRSFFSNGSGQEEPSNYGDDSFTDAKVKKSGLMEDLKALGPNIGKDAMTLLEKVMSKGEPYDDRTFLVKHRNRALERWFADTLRVVDGKNHSLDGIFAT